MPRLVSARTSIAVVVVLVVALGGFGCGSAGEGRQELADTVAGLIAAKMAPVLRQGARAGADADNIDYAAAFDDAISGIEWPVEIERVVAGSTNSMRLGPELTSFASSLVIVPDEGSMFCVAAAVDHVGRSRAVLTNDDPVTRCSRSTLPTLEPPEG